MPYSFSESLWESALRSARILIVDDESMAREELTRRFRNLGYGCECCPSGLEALVLLQAQRFDLVLADALMPEMEGSAFLREALRVSPDVAVILTASGGDIEEAVGSLKAGAYDWIAKPFNLDEVAVSVSRALEKRRLLIEKKNYERTLEEQVASRTSQLKEALRVLEHTYHSTLVALSKALDSRDTDSDGRSLRVMACAKHLGRRLGLSEAEMRIIEQGALLHDIGKIGIPDCLLRKQGPCSEEEIRLLRRHPEIGYRILSSIKFLAGAALLVWQHHENYDGSGYPRGLRGEEIDLGARIFAAAEALEDSAARHPDPGVGALEAAIRETALLSGCQLDPGVVAAMLEIPASEWMKIRGDVPSETRRSDLLLGAGPHPHLLF